MTIREENRNMMLLATVALVSATIAGGVALLDSLDPPPARPAAASQPTYRADTTSVRVVGAPFVPNTDPHRR